MPESRTKKKSRIRGGEMILAENRRYSLDCYRTCCNNNVLVVGAAGAGKTRSIVSPNLLEATGSYVVVDPKGNLYGKYKDYLRAQGYNVRKLNFAEPGDPESESFNYFRYIKNDSDILKISRMLAYIEEPGTYKCDPFWDESCTLLLTALNAYLFHYCSEEMQNLYNVNKLLLAGNVDEDYTSVDTDLDRIFEEIRTEDSDSFTYQQYRKYRLAAGRTLKSVLISTLAKIGVFTTAGHQKLLGTDTVSISSIGFRKTALFVIVSDTDRANDPLANIFFTLAMHELCRAADGRPENRLPVDVRFILDDFATNVKINEFPRMISSFRSRGISCMLMLQAESQLRSAYGADDKTIIGNCDTYVYLGCNDVDTACEVAKRLNRPLSEVLYMPVNTNWIFRRGEQPYHGKNFSLEPFEKKKRAEIRQITR